MREVASPGYDRGFVGWLSLAQLITWGSVFYTFALLLEPVERELGLSRAQSSLAFSLALLAEGLLAYPVGRWIDRGHEQVVMTGGSLLVALGLAAHAHVRTAEGFYAVWALLGAALAATLYTPVFAVVTRRYPHSFRRAIITLTFLGGLASTVFIPLTAWLIARFGWREALYVLAAVQLLVCAPLHWVMLRNAPKGRGVAHSKVASIGRANASPTNAFAADGNDAAGATAAATAGVAAVATAAGGDPAAAHHSPRALLRSAPFLLIGVFSVGMMGITAALPPHMISLLREAGLDERWVIAIPATIGVIQVLGRLLLFFFEHHFDLHVANRVIPCLVPIALAALLAGARQPVAAVLFVVLYGLGNGMMTIVKGTAIAQYVNREHVASLNGALGFPQAVSRALAPLLLGVLWTRETGYQWGIALLLGVGIVSAIALWQAQRHALTR